MPYEIDGKTKFGFLKEYRGIISADIANINAELAAKYSQDFISITEADAWVLFNCEAGLKSDGTLWERYPHNEGEFGVLPLPDNISFWNGEDAPDWDKPMSVDVNFRQFLRYIGNVKNKLVATRANHRYHMGAFRYDGIAGSPLKQAKVAAGVVHGYFESRRYDDNRVPVSYLIERYAADEDLAEFMLQTRYVHAIRRPSVLRGRARNIADAVRWLQE